MQARTFVRIFYLYCHPLTDSFHAAVRAAALSSLTTKAHVVDLADLYHDDFQPALTARQREIYFESPQNEAGIGDYADRLRSAEALVVQFPTWCFGPPAMLKGFFDRVLIPGVAFDPQTSKPSLDNLKKIVGVVTYGQSWTAAMWMGEAPRKTVTRFLPWFTGGKAKAAYHALYRIDDSTDAERKAFIERVGQAMAAL